MVRAHLLTLALCESNPAIIGPGRPLFIAGGGVAGVTAALTACQMGVDVALLEKDKTDLFKVQLGVRSRRLDPTEFDWPHAHWNVGDIEWNNTVYALPYSVAAASDLAADWALLVNTLFDPTMGPLPPGFGKLDIYYGADASKVKIHSINGGIDVSPWFGAGAGKFFGAALSCIGSPGERTEIQGGNGGIFVGPKFWAADSIAAPDLGLRHFRAPLKILVSGGGDGAQQDFLRVLTGNFGRPLFEKFGLDKLGVDLRDVLLAEDFGRRAHAWSKMGSPPLEAYEDWHRRYVELADVIWKEWVVSGQHVQHHRMLLPGRHVTWMVGGQTPGYSYGLNRLLALLVAKLHAMDTGRVEIGGNVSGYVPTGAEVILLGCKMHRLRAMHVCDDSCNGSDHDVLVSGDGMLVPTGPHLLGSYQFLVPRHGVIQRPLFGSAPVTEQLVPMDAPR